jgi:hypothetical protein
MQDKLKVEKGLFALLIIFVSGQSQAFMAMKANEKIKSDQYFGSYEQNSFMFKHTSGDDNSTELDVSLKYYFKSGTGRKASILKFNQFNGFNPFFSYTSKNDFYWTLIEGATRPSAPVISRYQNPALHFQYLFQNAKDWIDVGLEHISNGQALTAKDNKALIQNAYQTNNNAVLDSVSRVNAMVALTIEGRKTIGNNSDLIGKVYAYRDGQEADVYWGKFANQKVDFNDFQLIKIQWRTLFDNIINDKGDPWQFAAEMNLGYLGVTESSWNFIINTPIDFDTSIPIISGSYRIPLAFAVHHGPMNNMSDYTRSQDTYSIGVSFSF